MCLYVRMLAFEWKEGALKERVNSRCFWWFSAAILAHQNGAPIWRLHRKLYKGAWNVSANTSETVRHKDLRLGQIVYILVFYNISFSWLLPLDSFQFIFLLRDKISSDPISGLHSFYFITIYFIRISRLKFAKFIILGWLSFFNFFLFQNDKTSRQNEKTCTKKTIIDTPILSKTEMS